MFDKGLNVRIQCRCRFSSIAAEFSCSSITSVTFFKTRKGRSRRLRAGKRPHPVPDGGQLSAGMSRGIRAYFDEMRLDRGAFSNTKK
jgi:hypothetical protein